MATAVKNSTETSTAPQPQAHLLRASLIGAVYVAVCLGLVFFGIPMLWKATLGPWLAANLNNFINLAGMALAVVAGTVVLLYLGARLAGDHPPPGLRAGVFIFVAGGLLLFLITVGIGGTIRSYFPSVPNWAGLTLMVVIGIGLVVLIARFALGDRYAHYFAALESQGWFSARSYKPTQGRLVRRLTMLGIIAIIGSGVYSLVENKMLSGDWKVRIPFTEGLLLEDHRLVATLLPDIRYTVPLLLIAAGLWVAWRTVNYPTFADFLIATEAELNKVSWVTRKRLIQDTIVVLVTLLLFTLFLLVIDQAWGWLLTRETLGGIVPKTVDTKPVADPTAGATW